MIDLKTLSRHNINDLSFRVTPGWTYIYGLCDPETGDVRYVGKSRQLVRRVGHHLSKSRQAGLKRHSACWLKGLLRDGKQPMVMILEAIPPEQETTWEVRERHWITVLRASGCNLTNIAPGGEGVASYGRLGKRNSPEHIAKTRAGRLGKPCRRADADGWNRRKAEGVRRYHARMKAEGILVRYGPASEERKRKIGDANRGRKYPPSEARKQVLREQAKRAQEICKVPVFQLTPANELIAKHPSLKEASLSSGVGRTSISNCLSGRAQSAGGFKWTKQN